MKKEMNMEFNQTQYMDFLTECSIEDLKDELDKNEVYLSDIQAAIDTNTNMIDKFYDNPAYEHLINMNIMNCPDNTEISLIKFKIDLIKKELDKRK